MKIGSATNIQKLLAALPEEKQARVNALVRRHLKACAQYAVPPDNLERVFIEAVEVLTIEEQLPPDKPRTTEWEPHRRYEQYTTPKDL